jgi:deoxyribodipyrimidine photolyase-related protein
VSELRRQLKERAQPEAGRRWRFVPYDQLSLRVSALDQEDPVRWGLLLVECPAKAARRPYHRQKLATVLACQRHFAVEAAEAGFAVRYVTADSYAAAVAGLSEEVGEVRVAEPAERELRRELAPLVAAGSLVVDRHRGWLTEPTDLGDGPPWRMDTFYRRARQRLGVLMDGGRPVGGKYSFDEDNRQPWRGEPPAPRPPRFVVDALTAEVGALLDARYAHHPGALDLGAIPASAADAAAQWAWARSECLPVFGPYEDAMSTSSRGLFHARIGALLNNHRLWPADVLRDALSVDLPLASREGFVRQILGWREFVRHVHLHTDGFRSLPGWAERAAGDGGWQAWAGRPWPGGDDADAGAAPLNRGAMGVPPAFWGARSGLRCLDDVVEWVWAEGWSHHITRLMVLGNLATLLGVDARDLTDWFWAAYVDAYDWVVEPNVLAMATFATDVMTTKPYVSGAPYLERMGDACRSCAFKPKRDCPITPMYWAWLAEHAASIDGNPRMWNALSGLRRRDNGRRSADAAIRDEVRRALSAGEVLDPARLARCAGER